jgi:hypothetical protein
MSLPARGLSGVAIKVQILAHEIANGPSIEWTHLATAIVNALERISRPEPQ